MAKIKTRFRKPDHRHSASLFVPAKLAEEMDDVISFESELVSKEFHGEYSRETPDGEVYMTRDGKYVIYYQVPDNGIEVVLNV